VKVLQITSESSGALSVELMLKSDGLNVYSTDLGEEGVDLAKVYDYDCLLLDLNLPDMTGFDVLRTLRSSKVMTPVIVVTGNASIEAKVKAFAGGADDYLTKPFHRDELVSRIHAVTRRSKGHAEPVITIGPIQVDLQRKEVRIDGKPVHFTGKEYQLVEALALRKGMTLSKESLMNHVYGRLDEPEIKIVDVFICKIRHKLGVHAVHVETVWGRGYRFSESPAPKDKTRVQAPTSRIAEIVTARLKMGHADFRDLRNLNPAWNSEVLRQTLYRMCASGSVVNIGQPRRAVYRLAGASA
jgi:two-component system cell cycle response regulator CtrA